MATLAPSPAGRPAPEPGSLYERDFYSWSRQQAEALKRRDFAAVDWENVIEEIEDLGIDKKNLWTKFCARVIEHLLKIEYWDYPTRGALQHWAVETGIFRYEMAELIEQNPGLKGHYAEMFAAAWKRGRYLAVKRFQKYDLEHRPGGGEQTFRNWGRLRPKECLYRLEHVTAFDAKTDQEPREDVWPPAVARILNTNLKQNYPILPDYKPERGPSRGFTWDR